jgi:hypothetical protein
VGFFRAATAGLLSKICLGALARAGRAGMGPSRVDGFESESGATLVERLSDTVLGSRFEADVQARYVVLGLN